MSAPALATRGLAKAFGSLVVARDIEIELPKGVRYALIGPNGAGKTTLINLITGMLRPDAGQILLDDTDITTLPPDQRVRRGLVRYKLRRQSDRLRGRARPRRGPGHGDTA